MAAALYTTDILRMAASIPHLGRLADPDISLAQRAPTCGSHIQVDIALDKTGHIRDFAQEVRACALGQASAYLLGAHIIGRTVSEVEQAARDLSAWLSGAQEAAPNWPGIDALAGARAYPGRHGAIRLPFDTVALALRSAEG